MCSLMLIAEVCTSVLRSLSSMQRLRTTQKTHLLTCILHCISSFLCLQISADRGNNTLEGEEVEEGAAVHQARHVQELGPSEPPCLL